MTISLAFAHPVSNLLAGLGRQETIHDHERQVEALRDNGSRSAQAEAIRHITEPVRDWNLSASTTSALPCLAVQATNLNPKAYTCQRVRLEFVVSVTSLWRSERWSVAALTAPRLRTMIVGV